MSSFFTLPRVDYEPSDSPASENGIIVLRNRYHLDISQHRSALLSTSDVEQAHILIGVSRSHAMHVLRQFGEKYQDKIHSLDRDIRDPWHQNLDVYESCAAQIQESVSTTFPKLFKLS